MHHSAVYTIPSPLPRGNKTPTYSVLPSIIDRMQLAVGAGANAHEQQIVDVDLSKWYTSARSRIHVTNGYNYVWFPTSTLPPGTGREIMGKHTAGVGLKEVSITRTQLNRKTYPRGSRTNCHACSYFQAKGRGSGELFLSLSFFFPGNQFQCQWATRSSNQRDETSLRLGLHL